MLKSTGIRYMIVALLVLLMFIPLFFAAEVIEGRKHHSQNTQHQVGHEWGGAQSVSGPVLIVPVERSVERFEDRPKLDLLTGRVQVDAAGKAITERVRVTGRERVAPLYIYPEDFDVTVDSQTEIRSRGIFSAPVYSAQLRARFSFAPAKGGELLDAKETALWDKAALHIYVSANRALRGKAQVQVDGTDYPAEPLNKRAGLSVAVGDPRGHQDYALALDFHGAQELFISPVGRNSSVSMTSDWPHPSFTGGFLPNAHEVTDDGFKAQWQIPHLARSLPQISRYDSWDDARAHNITFGVRLIEPNDFYQKAFRAARYGILFIALTFLTILLTERGTARPTHPVQYILVGLAQTVFVLLMVAYAEHLGFELSYLISAGATIALLTLFGAIGLKMGSRVWVLSVALVVVYAVLYMILKSADYALLAGSSLAFLALAATMIATRNEDWYGPQKPKPEEVDQG